MAKKDKVKEQRRRSRFAAMEGLRPRSAFPVPPRQAMSRAKKASKNLSYPVSPYPSAGPIQVARWSQHEWWRLGKWQRLALPFIVLSALLTWEREKEMLAAREVEVDRIDAKRMAVKMYGAYVRPKKKRKLLGFIPLPSRQ